MAWTKEAFDDWKARSGDFFQFLKDNRSNWMELWASSDGSGMDPRLQVAAEIYGELIDLNYEEKIEPFYEKDDEDEE